MIAKLFLIFSYKINFTPLIPLTQRYSGLSNDANFQSGTRDWGWLKTFPLEFSADLAQSLQAFLASRSRNPLSSLSSICTVASAIVILAFFCSDSYLEKKSEFLSKLMRNFGFNGIEAWILCFPG